MNQQTSDSDRDIALYNQNSDNFRGLNSQMWQIPIIGMTLTGGLWFGVSNVKDSPFFQMGLLLLASVGNVALIFILFRLRFVMDAYLIWLNKNQPTGRIVADGKRFYQKSNFVRTVFQSVLGVAALISLVLLGITAARTWRAEKPQSKSLSSYYDAYASALGDENEVPDFGVAHPQLAALLRPGEKLTVLHIGSGAIRDARAIAGMGNRVLVAAPSPALARVPRAVFGENVWTVHAPLPDLINVRGSQRFDLIVVNGVWAHVPADQRQRLMDRLIDLLRPCGRIYFAFRDGPADPDRVIYASSPNEIRRLASSEDVVVTDIGGRSDTVGRAKVTWRTVLVQLKLR